MKSIITIITFCFLFLSCKKESLEEYLVGKCGTITERMYSNCANSVCKEKLKIQIDNGKLIETWITTERTDLSWCMTGERICFFKVNTTRICP